MSQTLVWGGYSAAMLVIGSFVLGLLMLGAAYLYHKAEKMLAEKDEASGA